MAGAPAQLAQAAGPRRRRFLLGTAATLAAGLAGCARAPRRVAFLGGLTGRIADLGVGGRDGVLLALEQANAQGGLDGRRLELDAYDDAQEVETARSALARLHAAGHHVVIGPMTSAMAQAVLPMAQDLGVTLLSPTVTTSELDRRDDAFLRIVSGVTEYARRSAEFHAGRKGLRRFAVVLDAANASYARAWAGEFARAVAGHGAQVVHESAYRSGPAFSVDALVDGALAPQPQALAIVTGAFDAARIAQAVRKRDAAVQLLASEWSATGQFIQLAGRAAEGVHHTQFLDRQSPAPAYRAFVAAFMERYAREPDFAEVAGYDAVQVLLKALAVQREGESAKAALLRVRRFEGLQDEIVFDDWGDAARRISITRVQAGRFEGVPA